jgi:hypothetical protein
MRLSENEKKFRTYLKKFHQDKYKELIILEKQEKKIFFS